MVKPIKIMELFEDRMLEYFGSIDPNFIESLSDPEMMGDTEKVVLSNGDELPLDKYREMITKEWKGETLRRFPETYYVQSFG